MILNLVVIVLVAFMVYWWSTQGAFSSLLHLVLTVLAAMFALALWEPLAVKLTLPYLPEYGWGVALLVPFGLILLGLRIGFDKKITANLNFHPNMDRLLGGAFGFGSGVLTAGILVIGLQMSGMNALLGYKGWEVKAGEPQQEQTLWIPVDTITAGVLGSIAGGSMSPVVGEGAKGFEYYHPDLAIEASMYHKSAFWSDPAQAARRALNPAHVELMGESYYVVPQITDTLARSLGVDKEGHKAVVVGVKIALMEAAGGGGGDKDSVFYATANQVALVSRNGEEINVEHPISVLIYDPRGSTYVRLNTPGEYAYSRPSAPSVRHLWMFKVPAGAEPQYIRIKQARIDLPPVSEAKDDAVAVERMTLETLTIADATQQRPPETGRLGDPEQRTGPAPVGEFVEVTDRLPFTMSKNTLKSQSVEVIDDAIVAGTARVPSSRERIGKELAVNRIFSPTGAKIVQVKMGTRKAGSLLGQVMQFAATVTQAPVLRDQYGDYYFAIGYGVKMPAEFKFSIDRNNVLRSLQPLQLGSLTDTDELTLYYQVPNGTHLVSFDMGTAQKQTLSVQVP